VSNRLREIRGNVKLLELAARIRCSPTTLHAIERYDHQPRESTKERIASALGVPISRIWPSE
jgi:DNA-binding XRE family transcriptional regulator